MCANHVPPPPRALREHFGVREPAFGYAADAYPASAAVMLRPNEPAAIAAGEPPLRAEPARFGLLPPWARDDKLMRQTYNARSETVAEKPSFRSAWRRRQFCLIPVQTWFEPSYESGTPVRWRIERADGAPFCLAGLWENAPQTAADGSHSDRLSFTMLTINADTHPLMARFHAPGDEKRSVVVLHPDDHAAWLQADEPTARALLQPFDAHDFVAAADPRPVRRMGRPSAQASLL
jgi:putative SOS response-associated peptidase YedK